MSYHARRSSTVCASQRQDGMPRPTSFDRVCCPKALMACHVRCCSTLFAVHGLLWHAPPDVVRSCVLPKEDNGMPRPTSFDRVCCTKAVMSYHARRISTVCASQRKDGMPRPTSFDRVCCPKTVMACHARRRLTVCAAQGPDVMPCSTSFNRVCCPKAMLACHARRRSTVCASQR